MRTVRLDRFGRGGLVLLAAIWLPAALPAQTTHITLAGTWSFALDAADAGHQQKWWQKKLGPDEIYLPGTTDLGGYGTKTHGPEPGWLSRPYTYQGAAWYQKEVEIPESWRGRHIELFLERAHWQTEVWVDDAAAGSRNSLSTPHVYDLTGALKPGRHRITICVDNSLIVDVGVRASSVTDYTQTNWNGIVGRIELRTDVPVAPTPPPHRVFGKRGTRFTVDGEPVILRGTLECADFPLTGHPPMDFESWDRILRIAKDYGLNHIRFHSWCPPEAAFEAGDRNGFWFQVELPVWSHRVGKDPALNEFMRAEGLRILKTYGHHPSLAMLCLGNELSGDWTFMDQLIAEFKKVNSRILYTFTDDISRRTAGPTSDYHVTNATKAGRLRIWGSPSKELSSADVDYSASVAAIPVPLVAHELGQWAVYPSYEEFDRYTGLLKPRNLEAFRDQLAARGMLDQAAAFQQASGRFAWTIYKEDIERVLRSPGIGGLQLLQLEDFPGQGEALVGMLDPFWNSKGIVTPAEFRKAFGPLLRFSKRVWTNDETFTAQPVQPQGGDLWQARDQAGVIAGGGVRDVRLPLANATHAGRVEIEVNGPSGRNDWSIWVYPKHLYLQPPKAVLISTTFDTAARDRLAAGGRVLLLWPPAQPSPRLQPISFLPVFWSLSWFPKQAGTMGILCDPQHPALADFPTENHSDWQWWELTESARAFILDDLPLPYRPIVQVIDDFHRNHKLGAVFEARVGKGKLLVSSLDLSSRLDERVVARQLLYSLYRYVSSDKFAPRDELSPDALEKLLRVEEGKPPAYDGAHDKEAAPWPKKRP